MVTYLLIVLSNLISFALFATKTGPSSEPFISGDTWRNHVNFVLSDEENFDPRNVKLGDLIYVEQDSLNDFYQFYVPHIQSPYILITANCDRGGDDPMPGKYEKILDDPNLYAWFTQNLDRSNHPKLHPIPIGLANRKWQWGMIERYFAKMPEANARERTKWLYVNFQVGSNAKLRKPIWDYFARNSLNGMVHMGRFKDHLKYMDEMPNFRFVLSPPGNGLDCHRTWEALLLGSYPIVLSSTLNPLYEELPILIINNWTDLTPKLLEDKYQEFKSRNWNFDKLYFKYWFGEVQKTQDKIRM